MGSDRARATFEEKKQYRRVVHQQGRVSLEADLNEAQEIFGEGARRTGIDLLGPTGAPAGSDGYAIGIHHEGGKKTRDLTIGRGAFYLGGLRIMQSVSSLRYTTQVAHDWAEGPTDASDPETRFELAYLRLREQEVSAVEDRGLLEPAIGGPDTAQRVRLVGHVERFPLAEWGEEAGRAFHELKASWRTQGITVDPTDMRLERSIRLQVTPGTSGYLGPENQMIRVQIAQPAEGDAGPTQLLWAYDGASTLHSVDLGSDATDLTKSTLKIVPPPVDAAHQPKAGQAIEILLPAVSLGGGDYAAQTGGHVTAVASAYNPADGTIVVDDLPPEAGAAQALFVRVWQSTLPLVLGSPVSLVDVDGNDTGLDVTVTAPADAQDVPAVPGDYWTFAVRPATPKAVYPARYQGPQPPEGPREWGCPLALVDWERSRTIDCRPSFQNLVAVSREEGCCTVTVGPGDLKARPLQTYLDEAAQRGARGTLCLKAGVYELDRTLLITERHSGVTIEACGGVEIRPREREDAAFERGLIEIDHARDVTLRGVHLVVPEVSFPREAARELSRLEAPEGDPRRGLFLLLASMRASAGLRLVATEGVKVFDCTFTFERRPGRPAFGGGIVATGDVTGLDVTRCVFRSEAGPKNEQPNVLFGYLHAPPAGRVEVLLASAAGQRIAEVFTHPPRDGFVTRLTETTFRQNTFTGLSGACLALTEIGQLRIQDNQVRRCYGGFWLLTQNGGPFEPEGVGEHDAVLGALLHDPMLHWSVTLARCLDFTSQPRPRDFERLSLDLSFLGNAVDVNGAALIGWHSGKDDKASAIVSANHLTNSAAEIPTGVLVQVQASTLTGNVLLNRAQSAERNAVSFVVSHGKTAARFAASGNAHEGEFLLPREGVLREIAQALRGDR